MRKGINRAVVIGLAVAGVAGISRTASAQLPPPPPRYDWDVNGDPGNPEFGPSIFLRNDNAAQVDAFFAPLANAGGYPADDTKQFSVKVTEPLTNPASIALFDKYYIKYVFADFEDAARVGRTRALADQVLSSGKSSSAFVGNFNTYPRSGTDTTRPGISFRSGAQSFNNSHSDQDFNDIRGNVGNAQGNRVANPALYPGAPDFRVPLNGTSGAPNVRSSFFTLPIQRLTTTENGLRNRDNPAVGSASGYNTRVQRGSQGTLQNIPYVTRFNNWGNTALDNIPGPAIGFQSNAGTPANGSLPSRGDFQAQIQHYRLRGADSVIQFNSTHGIDTGLGSGSIVGYSDAQMRDDINAGWTSPSVTINDIRGRGDYAFANLTQQIKSRALSGPTTGPDGTNPRTSLNRDISRAGAVWSGVFDQVNGNGRRVSDGGTPRMALLLSNLRTENVEIDLPAIGGFVTTVDKFVVEAGRHRLLTFALNNGKWTFNSNTFIFSGDLNRNGIGIPEPASLGLLGLGAVGLLGRRRRATNA